ncbi:MAG TPA: hypothetical protein PLO62_03200 [Candidatus Hydrogenedentes bacterium]|nr:hypothetical protein [Candidatus Hydrogenedentota bacterium]HOS04384.1 hypothetical protein [Candidatus Hydrogenedentota bacterium]
MMRHCFPVSKMRPVGAETKPQGVGIELFLTSLIYLSSTLITAKNTKNAPGPDVDPGVDAET